MELFGGGGQIDIGQYFVDCFSVNIGGEGVGVILVLCVYEFFFGYQLIIGQVGQVGFDDDIVFKVQDVFQIVQCYVQYQVDV